MMPLSIRRFARYALVNVSTLLLDLTTLYLAVSLLHVPLVIATPLSFLFAVSVDYALSRRFVFKWTQRQWRTGYLYFALFALVGAAVTTGLTETLVTQLGLYYLMARILVAGLIGISNYVFNLCVNFRVVGMHAPALQPVAVDGPANEYLTRSGPASELT